MAANDFIVAIELGSSKVIGVAGNKNSDGSITVLAMAKEDSSAFIRKGVVYNIDKTVQCINNIKRKLTQTLHTEIKMVYVGVGGQSIRGVKNTIVKNLPAGTVVTQSMVNEMTDADRDMLYQDKRLMDAVAQEYGLGNQLQIDPVGIQCSKLEGTYLNILFRSSFFSNLKLCFEKANLAIAEWILSPLALTDSVLTDPEKRSGCMLVDLGADTTTVMVYYKNVLRHISVIPLGGSNITKDIASLQMEDSEAEKMKLKHAVAFTENSDIDNSMQLSISNDRTVESRKFVDIVESRLQEIIENVWYQVPAEYTDRLLGGIVLTGGGANMRNIDVAFRNYTKIEKIRIAKSVTLSITSKIPEVTSNSAVMNTVLGILAKGDMNCAGSPVNPNAGLFDQPGADESVQQPSQRPLTGDGVVREDTAQGRDKPAVTTGEAVEEQEEEKKKPNKTKHSWSKFKRWVNRIVAEPEEGIDEQ